MTLALGVSDAVAGRLDPDNRFVPGAYTVRVGPQQMGLQSIGNFECYHIAVAGPPGSTFQVYVGNDFYDYVANGDINSWDPSQPMKLTWGNTVYFYWSVAAGAPIPTVTMYFQEASPL